MLDFMLKPDFRLESSLGMDLSYSNNLAPKLEYKRPVFILQYQLLVDLVKLNIFAISTLV